MERDGNKESTKDNNDEDGRKKKGWGGEKKKGSVRERQPGGLEGKKRERERGMAAVECNLKSFLVKLRKMRAVGVRGSTTSRDKSGPTGRQADGQ